MAFLVDHSVEVIRDAARPLTGATGDYDSLIDSIGNAHFVLLGEATHGTHEFYNARAEITKRLVAEKGFNVIAWEADWPDTLRVNRFVQGGGSDPTANDALGGFKRFPTWMWRNKDIVTLVEWLRAHNATATPGTTAGVYGLDLYSLHASMDAVIAYLQKTDPQAAREARQRYSCFEDFGEDPQTYGMSAGLQRSSSCEEEVVRQLVELQRRAADYLSRDGRGAADELFYAEQNAIVARNAEHYYRAMYHGRANTWNLRDTHMTDTLDHLMRHFEQQGQETRAVVWAHNSHLGDARATQMRDRGEVNVGQLVRERHGADAFLVGFTTYAGSVTAAADWGAPAERKNVRPALDGSYERLFHETGLPKFLLPLRDHPGLAKQLRREHLERYIGVIYRPETERWSHYSHAKLSAQFDAVIHFDMTHALEPLERTQQWDKGELPETFPSGL